MQVHGLFSCILLQKKSYTRSLEELTGARFTTSYTRIGGVARDIPDGWLGRVDSFCKGVVPILNQVDKMLLVIAFLWIVRSVLV